MADPRKLDNNNPKNTNLGVKRKTNTPEDSRKVLKGTTGRGANISKTKSIAPGVLKENLLKALEMSLGIVSTACRAVDCSRDMHYHLLKNDEDYARRYAEIGNVALDFVESRLFEKIKEKDAQCIIFYLKTKGKKRGFVERIENELTLNQPVDLSKLTEEELIMYASIQMKLNGQDGQDGGQIIQIKE